MVLEQMLGTLSVRYRIVGSAAEGLTAYAEQPPALLLSDMTLPDMSVADFALAIRRLDPAALMIALLPADTDDYRRQAEMAGFDHSLSKPISAEAMGALIPDLLSDRAKIPAHPD
jgi:CheY-like chemotaxis protein